MYIPVIAAYIILYICQIISAENESNGWAKICQGGHGSMLMSNADSLITTIKEGSTWTVFVTDIENYAFECTSISNTKYPPVISGITYGGVDDVEMGNGRNPPSPDITNKTIRHLDRNKVLARNDFNKENFTITCGVSSEPICTSTIIVLTFNLEPECEYNSTLQCDLTDINYAIKRKKESHIQNILYAEKTPKVQNEDIKARFGDFSDVPVTSYSDYEDQTEHSPGTFSGQLPSPTKLGGAIKYSIFENNKWIYCDEFNVNEELMDINTWKDETKSIRCNIAPNPDRTPKIIRIEQHEKKNVIAALPIFTKPTAKIEYSYFLIYINDSREFPLIDTDLPNKHDIKDGDLQIALLSIIISVVVVVGIAILVWFLCYQLNPTCKSRRNQESFKFYVNQLENGIGNQTYGQDFGDIEDICGLEEADSSNNAEKVEFRKTILARQLSGDPTKINPELPLNSQAKIMTYNPKFEIARSNFVVGKIIGGGHFGSVYEGDATGLFDPNSKTQVAVKTVNDPLDGKQKTALLCEIKILSNLELHLNLVNMLGSCTTEFAKSGEFFMLLEFCEKGDMKKFLNLHENDFTDSINGMNMKKGLDDRLLVQWAFHIAKGMQYLARMHIMHGDLAARNILIGRDTTEVGASKLVAKISDFGLSKTFYDNIRYKKQNRHYVPWKWMALEYLQSGHLTITSDVWSYGVVLWEIFSLGKEPYMTKSMDDMLVLLKNGYYLPCPEEALKNSKTIYDQLAKMCFVADPMKRATFSDIVEELDKKLTDEEKSEYRRQSEQYTSMSSRISDPNTQLKRASLNRPTSDRTDLGLGPSYLQMARIDNPKNTQIKLQKNQSHIETYSMSTDNNSENHYDPESNITLTKQEIIDSAKKALNTCDNMGNDNTKSEIFDNQNIDSDKSDEIKVSLIQPKICETPTLNHGYITIQAANDF